MERERHRLRSPGRPRSEEGSGRRRARRGTIRTVVGVAGVLVQGDDLHALLPVQVVVQLLGRAAVPGGTTVAAFAAAAAGPAQILALQGSGRCPGRELRALQRAEHRELGHRQGGQTGQGSRRRSHARRGGGGRRSGRGGGGGGEGGRALAEAVSRGLGSLGRLELGEGPAAFKLAALREKLLPVLQIGGIHLQERGSAGVSGLQHRSSCGEGRKGTEDVRPPPRPGRAAPTPRSDTRSDTRGLCPRLGGIGGGTLRPSLSLTLPRFVRRKTRPEKPEAGATGLSPVPAPERAAPQAGPQSPPAARGARSSPRPRRTHRLLSSLPALSPRKQTTLR